MTIFLQTSITDSKVVLNFLKLHYEIMNRMHNDILREEIMRTLVC